MLPVRYPELLLQPESEARTECDGGRRRRVGTHELPLPLCDVAAIVARAARSPSYDHLRDSEYRTFSARVSALFNAGVPHRNHVVATTGSGFAESVYVTIILLDLGLKLWRQRMRRFVVGALSPRGPAERLAASLLDQSDERVYIQSDRVAEVHGLY